MTALTTARWVNSKTNGVRADISLSKPETINDNA
jgi:hypothetical protein